MATYQCTALMGTNKKGSLKCDADGYYNVVLGALDYYNSSGAFYAYEPAKKLFDQSSTLQRRITKGVLRGECGHPKFQPGQSKKDFMMRVLSIEEQSVSHHISEVTIDETTVKDKAGRPVVTIMGRIKPCGPMGDGLAASLENDKENVCFSIRSLTDDIMDARGRHVKNLVEVITWDYVNECGIDIANKYDNPALEEFQSVGFTREHLVLAQNMAASIHGGMESTAASNIAAAMAAFGWVGDAPDKRSGLVLPPSARW